MNKERGQHYQPGDDCGAHAVLCSLIGYQHGTANRASATKAHSPQPCAPSRCLFDISTRAAGYIVAILRLASSSQIAMAYCAKVSRGRHSTTPTASSLDPASPPLPSHPLEERIFNHFPFSNQSEGGWSAPKTGQSSHPASALPAASMPYNAIVPLCQIRIGEFSSLSDGSNAIKRNAELILDLA